MAKFYCGTATIDEQLYLRKADDAFYKFIGLDMYATVGDAIYAEDFHRFQDALCELKEKDMSKNIVSVRFRRYDGKYRWILVEMAYEPFDIDGVAMINLKMTDLAESENNNAELKRMNGEYDLYLSLINSVLISYDISRDLLEIFMIVTRRRNYIYQGTLANWRKALMEKVEPSYREQFESLCADIEAGKKSFQYEIVINGFIRVTGKDFCSFKCQTVRSMARNYKVLGCVVMGGQNREKDVLFGNDDNKDAGLDMLNKRAITEYAKRVIKIGGGKKVYFVVLDLDNFKTINDTYGHLFGDEVLAVVTDIIKEAVGNRGVVGRIGGDEIFIVLDRVEEHTELRNLLRTIRTNIEWAYKGKKENVNLSCSMGIAAYPDHGDDYDTVFKLADKMLYRAKTKGKNRYIIYIPEIHDENIVQATNERKESWMTELKNDKLGIMQRIIENYLIRKIVTNEIAYSEVGYGFGLDEILMFCDNQSMAFQWTPAGVSTDIEEAKCVTLDTEFIDGFNKNNLFVINGLYNLEGKSPRVRKMLEEKGVQSAIFYKIVRDDKFFGYVMFARREHRQMWSEYEIMVMSIIGKIFGTAMIDR